MVMKIKTMIMIKINDNKNRSLIIKINDNKIIDNKDQLIIKIMKIDH